jgi:hypothetical protein
MESAGNNNILALLLELSANPQRAASAAKVLTKATADLESSTKTTSEHTAETQRATKAHQDATAALRLQDQELTAFTPKVHTLSADFSRLNLQGRMAIAPMREMQESFRTLTPEIAAATNQTEQHTNALGRAAEAMRSQSAAGIAMAGAGLAGLVAGRKAQAGVEAVWETARGIALLAEGTWPPNPAAIAAAGLHFEAAAQYALLAGTGSHRRSAGGGGGGGYGSGASHGAGDSSYGPPMQTLAPGAASPSPMAGSGVVIIRGTQAFEDYVAGAVNGAVSRGVSVTATTSQRGAPVGH